LIAYASRTGTRRNLAALRAAGWRILVTPAKPLVPSGFHFALDNGAWTAFQTGRPFDEIAFADLVEKHGAGADFVVAPDIVAGGMRSLEFSLTWLPRLKNLRQVLLPLQDGMSPIAIGEVLRAWPAIGLFLGGSTEWKLATMYQWGAVAAAFRRPYHVGRVNTTRRIRLCAEAGATSFDGTSASMYCSNVPKLTAARNQSSLLTPAALEVGQCARAEQLRRKAELVDHGLPV
jgi:hypothetical protein